ncbi:hypothetical protein LCGC14_1051630 [marine sediment metagenome]|uniref:Uncharacterized protein n=1 Tax=marine sediment metagenome TaxID=412755 RepID=A0A0F9NAI0_9ZZZZ
MKMNDKNWKGKDLWEDIQTYSCIVLLIAALIISNYKISDGKGGTKSIITPEFFEKMILGLIFYVLIYLIGYFYALHHFSEKNAGIYVMKGHMDQGRGLGEDFRFIVKKFKRVERLTRKDKDEIKKLLEQAKADGYIKKLSNEERLKLLLEIKERRKGNDSK